MPHTHVSQSTSTAHGPNNLRAPNTKAVPPTFINLNDCKPILSTTATNTSTNSSANGTTAFVFTSSRTLRALQDESEETSSVHRLSPGSIPSSPTTPPSCTTSDGSSQRARSRASLTLSQLVRHSDGAVDARSLLGPKMRAAGFVNLPSTLGSRSDSSCPSTPSSPASISVSVHVPFTPSAPPCFPPIVFVNPTAVMTAPMWEYQRDMQWSLTSMEQQGAHSSNISTCSTGSAGSSEFTPGPRQGSAFTPGPRSEDSPLSSMSHPVVQVARRPVLQGLWSSSGSGSFGSSSTFASGTCTSTSLSSVEEADEDMVRDVRGSNKGKARAREIEPSEYPFPTGRDSPQSHGSRGSRASSVTASPPVVAAPPAAPHTAPSSSAGWQDPQATKPPSPRRLRRSTDEKRDKGKEKEKTPLKPAFKPTPTFATGKRRNSAREYSLTELCDTSPLVWMTTSDMFAPPAPISRSLVSTAVSSISSSPAASRPRRSVDPPHPHPHPQLPTRRHRRHHTTADGRSTNSDPSGRVHRIPSAPLRMQTIPSEHGSCSDRDSEQSHKRGRTTVGHDGLPAVWAQAAASKQDCPRAPHVSDPRSTDGAAPSGKGATADLGSGVGSGRGRNSKGKVLGASQTTEERAAAQEATDSARALDGLAALALAHKEREFDFARNIVADRERTKVLKQKQRVHHKLRGKLLREEPPSESETTMVDRPQVKTVP